MMADKHPSQISSTGFTEKKFHDINDSNNNSDIKQNKNVYTNEDTSQSNVVTNKKSALTGGSRLIRLKDGQEYIELDQFGKDGRHMSPFMINLCTFIYSLVPLGSILSGIFLVTLLFTRYWYVTLSYIIYLAINVKYRETGGQRFDPYFRSNFWRYIAAYFPIRLRFSSNFKLDPQENYMLNYSPHGISAFGCVAAFATDALNFTSYFPGITPRFMVHETVFLTPFMREFFAYRGDCSVSSKSIDFMLNPAKSGTGNLLTLVAGGLQEADLSDQEILKIVVLKRKGFIKKALINGANLIPSIAFGENSVFTKINPKIGSPMYHIETLAYRYLGFKHPIYWGHGTMPFKRPITVVIGNPIQVEKKLQPSQEEIDQLHERYVIELNQIYDTHADLRQNYDTKLELI